MTREQLNTLVLSGETIIGREDFSGLDLSGADLSNLSFRRCSFANANLSNINAANSKFLACDMANVEFSGAEFSGDISFENSTVDGMNLIGAKLNGEAITKQAFAGTMGTETVIVTDKFIECGCVVNPPNWFDGLNKERLDAVSDPRPGAAEQFWNEFGTEILNKRDSQ